jgi:hypothetical protein
MTEDRPRYGSAPMLHATDAWANMSTPARTKVSSVQVAASGRIVAFSAGLVCAHRGVFAATDHEQAVSAAAARWRHDLQLCLDEMRAGDPEASAAARWLGAWAGPVIGWSTSAAPPPGCGRTVVCTDLDLTVAVLSRVEGSLLLPRHRARPTWARVFRPMFLLDDSRLATVPFPDLVPAAAGGKP